MSLTDRVHFRMMSLVHETLYGVFRDPYKALQAAGLREGQCVLEVGCGPGFFTAPAASVVGTNGSVCALDISPSAVNRVRQKLADAGVTNAEAVLGDAAETGLPGSRFDLVFLFGFHPTAGVKSGEIDRILREAHRVLKPEGILAVEGRLQPPPELFNRIAASGGITQYQRATV